MVCTFLAEGYEEVEALAVVDCLRRAKIEVKIVSISEELLVKSSRGVTILADALFEDIDYEEVDALFLPGGIPGMPNLMACDKLCKLILEFDKKGKRLAAICAAPSIFGKLGLLKGKKATCFPGFEENLEGAICVSDRVVTDGNITTSRGMGTSVDLGLELVRLFKGEEESEALAQKICYR